MFGKRIIIYVLAFVFVVLVAGAGYLWFIQSMQTPTTSKKASLPLPKAGDTKSQQNIVYNYLSVTDQKAGSSVKISEANFAQGKGGYVLIYKINQDGTVGPLVGNSRYLGSGRHTNIEIKIYDSVSLQAGDTVLATMRNDNGNKEYGPEDEPLIVAKNELGEKKIEQRFSLE